MTVTEVVDRHSGEEIEINLAVDIPQSAALTALGNDRVTAIGFHDMGICSINPL
jgi:hypothetical protein